MKALKVCKTSKERYEKILEIKEKTPIEELCKDMPASIAEYLEYCKKLGFDEEPDYRNISKCLEQ